MLRRELTLCLMNSEEGDDCPPSRPNFVIRESYMLHRAVKRNTNPYKRMNWIGKAKLRK